MTKEELQEMMEDLEDDELILRKKKPPEQKTGVTTESVLKLAADAFAALLEKKPRVMCMTHAGAADFTLRALKALGATGWLVDDMGEASQGTGAVESLLVNVGCATKPQADAMRAAVSHANMGSKPWALDPEGLGALPLRTFTVKELMRRFPALICGNAAEIDFIVNNAVRAPGDTVTSESVAQDAARLATVIHAAVALTGPTDYVAVEGAPLVAIANGAPIMSRVAGLGSVQAALGAAILGALGGKARWEAALGAAFVTAIVGERAAAAAKGPGSFVPAFLDALAALKPGDIVKCGKVSLVPVEERELPII